MFAIFRSAHPVQLKFIFCPYGELVNNAAPQELHHILRKEELITADLDIIFDGSHRGDILRGKENLVLLRNCAQDIAETTYTERDSSINQLAKNLRSLIGQKAAEMNLLASLLTRDSQELNTYYGTTIFEEQQGFDVLSETDIREAAELVRRSRLIYIAYIDAVAYDKNLKLGNKKLSQIFSPENNANLSKEDKVLIYTLQYVRNRKSEAKSVKQFLKKTATFRAFMVELNVVLEKLYTLGVLTLVVRMDRSKRDANGDVIARRKRYFATSYDKNNLEQKIFFEKFQSVYPGQTFV